MTIYIDFDRTMFNTNLFLEDLYEILEKFNISKENFLKYAKLNEENGFNPFIILDSMKKDYLFDEMVYQKIEKLITKAEAYIYEDVYPFLEQMRLKGKIIILTKGNEKYQLAKIRNTKIEDKVDGIIVTLKEKGNLDLDYQHGLFIDDNSDEILSILKAKPLKVIQLKRDNGKSDSNLKNVVVIKSLSEIKTID